jgi:hypothetical protein
MTRVRALSWIVWLLGLLIAGSARAQTPPPPQTPAPSQAAPASSEPNAQELRREANDAMASLRPADALEGYRRAYELSHETALLYNMGRAMEALQDYPGAIAEYSEFLAKAPPDLRARVPGLAEVVAEMKRKVASVSFSSNVPGARVLVRDKALGSIPTTGRLDSVVNAGRAHVEIDADGFDPFVRDVDLPGGGELTITAELIPKDRAGILVVTTTPESADIAVDGKVLGAAPVEASVRAGMHTVTARRGGYRTMESTVVVAVGERRALPLSLEKKAKVIVAQWWFWTAAAVVVAGGVLATYAALTERSPDQGSIAPGLQRVQ